jgi:hypothetical protein
MYKARTQTASIQSLVRMSSQFRTIPNPDFTRRPVLPPSNYQNHGRLPANGADQRLQKKESFIDAVQEKLGSGVTVKESMSGDIDLLRSSPHSTTSLPYALGGSATHVQVEVASWLAGFQDPIKVCSYNNDCLPLHASYVIVFN